MTKHKLSQSTIEKLGYYVYLLIDPRNNKVFYVGKGKGNRINQHLLGALNEKTIENSKIKIIRDIHKAGKEVKLTILRHELTSDEAYEVESAAIDLLGIDKLTNGVKGHKSEDKGIMSLDDLKVKYEAKDAKFEESAILININDLYRRDLTRKEIYEATRKSWIVSETRVADIKIACAVYRGIIREVFQVKKWMPSKEVPRRLMFEGNVASEDKRDKYRNKSVAKYWKRGSQNPIKYVEIEK